MMNGRGGRVVGQVVILVACLVCGPATRVTAATISAQDVKAVEALINEHGKKPFVKMILAERSGRITLDTGGGKMKTGYGPPNERFVTGVSVVADLQAMGATVADLPRLLDPFVASHSAGGGSSAQKKFVVSNSNLASHAARGKVNVSGSSGGASHDGVAGASTADFNGSAAIDVADLHLQVAEKEEELARMVTAGEAPETITALRDEIAGLRGEIARGQWNGPARPTVEIPADHASGARPFAETGDGDDATKAYWVGR